MHRTPKERVDIGRRAFAHELTQQDAARQYGVSQQSIVNCVREYMKEEGIPVVPEASEAIGADLPDYKAMSKDGPIALLEKHRARHPSHGCLWLNAEIRMDAGLVMSDQYAHRCRKFAGIRSRKS